MHSDVKRMLKVETELTNQVKDLHNRMADK